MKMKTIYLQLVLSALLWPMALQAQNTIRSVDELWKYADAHNINIVSAKLEADKAKLAKRISYSALMPQINASGSFTDNTALQTTLIPGAVFGKPDIPFIAAKFGQTYIYNGTIGGQMDVLNLQSVFNTQVAKATEAYNIKNLANTRKSVYQQLASNYYNYLLMKEAERLNIENILVTDSVVQSTNNKFTEGTENEMNLNKAKINLEKIRENLINAQYQMLIAKSNIMSLLNLPLKEEYHITDSLEPIKEANTGVFQEDPAIQMAYSLQLVSAAQYQAAKYTFLPTLSLAYNYSTIQNNNDFKPFTNSVPWYPSSFWSVKANIPLFTGGSRIWQMQKAQLDLEENKAKMEAAIKQADINDANLKLAFKKAKAMVKHAEEVMRLSHENYIHASHRYETGVSNIDDKLKAFSDYIDNQNQYLNQLSDYLLQLYQIKIRQLTF